MSNEDDSKPISPGRVRMGFMNIEKGVTSGSPSTTGVKKTKNMNENERKKLGQELIDAARGWNFERFQELSGNPNVPVDYVEPGYLGTILHEVAGFGSVRMYEELLKREGELNYLARDWEGRLASELAAEHSDRNDLFETLIEKELAAAEKIGATVRPRQTIFANGSMDPPSQVTENPSPGNE